MTFDFIGTISLDKGRSALKQLTAEIERREPNWNEAETRFQFIDPLLTKCLGWPRPMIHVERALERKYTDYELGEPRAAIWEAKREGIYFDLPANPSRNPIVSLASIMQSSAEANSAVRQAQSYCSDRGVQYAVICNGHQLIAFLATRWDGVSPFDGKCLVFDGYLNMISEFPLLWQNLSPEGVGEKRLSRLLVKGEVEGIPRKLSNYVSNYHYYRYRNDSQTTLRTLAELLIEDVPNTPDLEEQFYNECYCESGALSQYALVSKSILNARYAALFPADEQGPVVQRLKPSRKEIAIDPSTISGALTRRPFVILGDVGVGKTSFLKNLIFKVAREEFGRAIYIYLDLGSQAALEEHLEDFVREEFQKQLLNRYQIDIQNRDFVRGVYNQDILRFRQGVYGDLFEVDRTQYEAELRKLLASKIDDQGRHLTESIRHLVNGESRQVILIIDNADQRNVKIQQDAFIIAQSFSSETDSIVFIAIRPQTFYRSRRSGSMSAYQQKVFAISPPRIDSVLDKRLGFALKISEGTLPFEGLSSFSMHTPTLSTYIKTLLYSVRKNKELTELLSNITGGNIRAVIELVRSFIGSPNVDSDKIIRLVEKGENYIIPVHEFSKSALLGEYSHFHEDSSIALNVYDIRHPDKREHFLILLIVAYLNYDEKHRDNDGFVRSDRIFTELQNNSFTKDQIDAAIRRATNKKLIETTQRVTFDEQYSDLFSDLPGAFRITTVGAYHLKKWASSFAYLDAMVFDTPVFDDQINEVLLSDPGSFEISKRYERAIAFRGYLTACWHEAGVAVPYFEWNDIVKAGQSSFKAVSKFIKSGPRKQRR
jgi:GTPase SAR1 family protein